MKKKHIVIVEILSTGINYVDDALARGYQPVVVEGSYPGSDEDRKPILEARAARRRSISPDIPYIEEGLEYPELLEKVRSYDPVLVVAGSEFGVELATRLGEDLGLPSNSYANIGKMTRKNEMHQALADYGIRSIRGRIVHSVEEAAAFFEELDTQHTVVKRARGAATQGMHFCEGREELLRAVEHELALSNQYVNVGDILVQERIIGTEYIVNTLSCNGKHRLSSMWVYDKVPINGSNIYNYSSCITRLDIGHSEMVRYAFDVLDAIGIKYGPVHGEYMIDEKGPVLIEVNCRPMGAGMERHFMEMIFGHHETDVALDSYLDPEKFELDRMKPYRPMRTAVIKIFIVPKDVELDSAPILQIISRLKSYYSASFGQLGNSRQLSHTIDLETAGGMAYLIHEDERVVMSDCNFLHQLEMKHSQMLFNEGKMVELRGPVKRLSIDEMLEEIHCHGTTIVLTDSDETSEKAMVMKGENLQNAYDSYEQGILDISRSESFVDMESTSERIFLFMTKVRRGGRVYIPESTYCHLPYGISGMEILLRTLGFRIEAPISGQGRMITASVEDK